MLEVRRSSGVLELTKELIMAIKSKQINSKQNGTLGGQDRSLFAGSDNET
jgi:hypothetical protein